MKNIRIIGLLIIALIGLNSCDQEDDLVFTAQEPTEGINFFPIRVPPLHVFIENKAPLCSNL